MRKSSGFSLIELVIAISLASFVLVGVATIAAQMARTQIDGIRSGTATGWSLVSYMSMAKEVEDSNVLAFPIADGASSDSLIVCKNWSRVVGGKLNTNVIPPGADSVSVIQYCVDTTAPVAPQTGFTLRRYANVGVGVVCPNPGVPVACSAAPAGTWTETGVVGFRLEKIVGPPAFPLMFQRDNSIGGVRIRYVIGRQTPTANETTAKFNPFDISIAMQKQYNNPLD